MSNSLNKIWIHAVWSTKYRQNLIRTDIEDEIYDFMEGQFVEMGCRVKAINGMPDHVHCLFQLNKQKSIAEVIKQIKGSTSYYINNEELTEEYFGWQSGYAAYSVSEDALNSLIRYIQIQKKHHKDIPFKDEWKSIG